MAILSCFVRNFSPSADHLQFLNSGSHHRRVVRGDLQMSIQKATSLDGQPMRWMTIEDMELAANTGFASQLGQSSPPASVIRISPASRDSARPIQAVRLGI
eukprot:TRINITY_DN2141_c0_g1_i7.p1 TRINITY_DN2141_c0_g1~~TRINITY_DN2141_c0_g1_i7.p1  ORF type:complete len:101 (+),score=2.19 TRINITY_DN2141_c0_g1_i7:78-380(+)